MTNLEINQAHTALIAWFKSQDITPGDAGIIMIRCIAEQFVLKSRNIASLQEAVNITNVNLICEIALLLKTSINP